MARKVIVPGEVGSIDYRRVNEIISEVTRRFGGYVELTLTLNTKDPIA